ncbi:MAG: peptidoglycan DD-metalloendopeptidase family protein [Pseudomonadota bacterium]
MIEGALTLRVPRIEEPTLPFRLQTNRRRLNAPLTSAVPVTPLQTADVNSGSTWLAVARSVYAPVPYGILPDSRARHFVPVLYSALAALVAVTAVSHSTAAQTEQASGVKAQAQRLAADAERLRSEQEQLNSQLISVAERVQNSEAQLTRLEDRLLELDAQKQLLLGSLTRENRGISKLLAALQRMTRNPPPVIITQRADALAMVRSAMIIQRVFPELRGRANSLSARLETLNRVVGKIRTATNTLKAETDELKTEQETLRSLVAEKQQRFVRVRAQLAILQREARSGSRSVQTLLSKLDQKVAPIVKQPPQKRTQVAAIAPVRRPKSETLAPEPGTQAVEPTRPRLPVTPDEGPDMVEVAPSAGTQVASLTRFEPAIAFEKTRGTLRFPVAGKRVWGFGDRTPKGRTSRGIAFQTRYNAQVTAPADGWVVHAGPFLSYRELLIIDAGKGYHMLIAGMQQRDVRVGQFVLRGEPVGRMAKKAETARDVSDDLPVVYVEFRRKGKPINPDPWWSRDSQKVQG